MNLYDILVKSAGTALSLQDSQLGYMPPGHNGSYHDVETPVRNTAHWLIMFLKAYEISGDKKYLEASYQAAKYLRSPDVRPMGATFWHRKNPKKNTCNGLIGQAWTIEALTVAAPILEMPELVTLAQQVFLLHPYNSSTGLWQCVSVDGTHLDFDRTFNHQLWFAAMGGLLSQLSQSNDVDLQVSRFLDCLTDNFQVHSDGLIRHPVSIHSPAIRKRAEKAANDVVAQIWKAIYWQDTAKTQRYLRAKEIGYHSFNLYAFALLKQVYPSHGFWQSTTFLKSLEYASSKNYQTDIQASEYGYPYNPPGFEIPFVLATFNKGEDNCERQSQWISGQLSRCYDFDLNLMIKNTKDKNTHSARLYEATRLGNVSLSIHTQVCGEVTA